MIMTTSLLNIIYLNIPKIKIAADKICYYLTILSTNGREVI